jgi:hypothetical protein
MVSEILFRRFRPGANVPDQAKALAQKGGSLPPSGNRSAVMRTEGGALSMEERVLSERAMRGSITIEEVLTCHRLADRIGCSTTTIRKEVDKDNGGRLAGLFLPEKQIINGELAFVFDGKKVREKLEELQELFGKGGKRLGPQEGELILSDLVRLIGRTKGVIGYELKTPESLLRKCLLPHSRVVKGHPTAVFDEKLIIEALPLLKKSLQVDASVLPQQAGELSVGDLARLIGREKYVIKDAIKRGEFSRCRVPGKRMVRGHEAVVFDEALVRQDLAVLRTRFKGSPPVEPQPEVRSPIDPPQEKACGLSEKLLPPQPGEITVGKLVCLLGCSESAIRNEILNKPNGGRFDGYLLSGKRLVTGQPASVFDEAKIQGDLERLKFIFGVAPDQLPPQSGEITIERLAQLIGINAHTVRKHLDLLSDYRAPLRYTANHPTVVFDEMKVQAALEKIKESFGLGGEHLPKQEGEIEIGDLADLIEVDHSTIWDEAHKDGGGRVAICLLPFKRYRGTRESIVFSEALAKEHLAELKESFGVGGNRLPLQENEVALGWMAKRIGCPRKKLEDDENGTLTPYILPGIRVFRGRDVLPLNKTAIEPVS